MPAKQTTSDLAIRVANNRQARASAAELIDLARNEADTLPDRTARETYWAALRDECLRHAPLDGHANPMDETEAEAFEAETIPFGQYVGMPVRDIPLDYLDWLVGERDKFKDSAKRYLKIPRVAQTLADELASKHGRDGDDGD